MRGTEAQLLGKIAGWDWGDDTQKAVDSAVSSFAEDFGFDLDEEGHPLDEDGDDARSSSRSREDQDDDQEDQAEAA
jgi:F-type H+-transporting ATPase subunit alpha